MFEVAAFFQQFSYFHFLRPAWFIALLPMIWALWALKKSSNPTQRWKNIIAPHLLKALLVPKGALSWFSPINASFAFAILVIISLTGPTWKQQPSPFAEDIAPLVIVLDASTSMQQNDIQPSRLARAKHKIQDLLALRPDGQTGLVVFAGTAHSVLPLTNDPEILLNFLDAIVPDMMPRKGKFPEKSLPIVESMLREADAAGSVLLIGDGVSPDTALAFDQYFSQSTHQLLILGVGKRATDESDTEASDLIAPLEQSALKSLASNSGGYYQSLTVDQEDIRKLQFRITSHFVYSEDGNLPWVDAGYYFIFPIALVALAWFRIGWSLQWMVLFLLVAQLATPSKVYADDTDTSRLMPQWFLSLWLTPNQQGRFFLSQGQYNRAANSFDDIAWRGAAYYRGENFDSAVEMFSRIESSQGFFNLGNALAHQRAYVLAVKAYKRALQIDPDHASAEKNRIRIQKIIDEINAFSASQKSENSDSQRELGDDEPQTADGAERENFEQQEIQQLTAEDILLNEETNALWMRQVQKDPSRFLSAKFYMQLEQNIKPDDTQPESGGKDIDD